jgi:hypothetical protein
LEPGPEGEAIRPEALHGEEALAKKEPTIVAGSGKDPYSMMNPEGEKWAPELSTANTFC